MAKTDGGIFMHAARPAQAAAGRYSDQRYFGVVPGKNNHSCLQLKSEHSRTSVNVLRFADMPIAQLDITIGSGYGARTDLSLHLDADQMQTLACALLDAAHEMRTVPATSKEEVAA